MAAASWAVGSHHVSHEEEVQEVEYIVTICAVQTKTMKDAVVFCSYGRSRRHHSETTTITSPIST